MNKLYRITGRWGKFYAVLVDIDTEVDIEDIKERALSCEPVIICGEDFSDLECFGIDKDDIEILKPE